jgi:hypothetical protein
MGSEKAYL